MDGRITIMGDPILVVSVYSRRDKPAREALFDRLLHLLIGYDGMVVMGGDFNCTLVPRLDRSFTSIPDRHDSLALRIILGRAQISDVLEYAMEIEKEERAIPYFRRRLTLVFTPCRAVYRLVPDWIGGMWVIYMLIGFETFTCQFLVLRLITIEKLSVSDRHVLLCASVRRVEFIVFPDVRTKPRIAKL